MLVTRTLTRTTAMVSTLLLAALVAGPAAAHCDSMDGPVVQDAQRAFSQGSVDPVLKWVSEADEEAIHSAFDMAVAVRGESEAAMEVADRYFFETLIRLHRATEGEAFTGLKPAGSTEPGIVAADLALASGDIEPLAGELAAVVEEGIRHRFAEASALRETADQSVEQGRDYVAAYVQFTHFVEGVDHLVAHGASPTHRETAPAAH
jgi:hypothetical protein